MNPRENGSRSSPRMVRTRAASVRTRIPQLASQSVQERYVSRGTDTRVSASESLEVLDDRAALLRRERIAVGVTGIRVRVLRGVVDVLRRDTDRRGALTARHRYPRETQRVLVVVGGVVIDAPPVLRTLGRSEEHTS